MRAVGAQVDPAGKTIAVQARVGEAVRALLLLLLLPLLLLRLLLLLPLCA